MYRLNFGVAVLLLLACGLALATSENEAPPLRLMDLQGEAVDLNELQGKAVLVNFWATWCPPCLVEMPSMQRLKEHMKGRPFVILAVNAGERETVLWQTRERFQLDYLLLQDPEKAVTEAWDVQVFPTSFVIDTQGRVAHRFRGMLEWDSPAAVSLIEALLPE